MAEGFGLGRAWEQALQAHARYYEALGRLTSSWLRELAEVGSQVRLPSPTTLLTRATAPVVRETVNASRHLDNAAGDPGRAAAVPTPAALVLEAPRGQQAIGAFLVENTLPRRVEQAVEAGPFTDTAGHQTDLALTLVPSSVALEPDERVVVRVSVTLPETLDAEHRGTIRVAGVPGAEIAVVVREAAG